MLAGNRPGSRAGDAIMLHQGRNRDAIRTISAAIRERIEALEEELSHWRKMLLECEEGGLPDTQPPDMPERPKARCVC